MGGNPDRFGCASRPEHRCRLAGCWSSQVSGESRASPLPAELQAVAGGMRYLVVGQFYERGTHLVRSATGSVSEDFAAPDGLLEAKIGTTTDSPALLFGAQATFVALDQPWDTLESGFDVRSLGPQNFLFARELDAAIWVRNVNATMPVQ